MIELNDNPLDSSTDLSTNLSTNGSNGSTQPTIPDENTPKVCGTAKAKFFAFGLTPTGYISVGVVPMGVLAIGIVPMGVISLGVVAMGTIATGVVSMGVAAFGGQTMSLLNLGRWQVGGIEIRAEPHHQMLETPPDSQPFGKNSSDAEGQHHQHHH